MGMMNGRGAAVSRPFLKMVPTWLVSLIAFFDCVLCLVVLWRVRDMRAQAMSLRLGTVILAPVLLFFAILYFYYTGVDVDIDTRTLWVRAGFVLLFGGIFVWLGITLYLGRVRHDIRRRSDS